MVLVGVADGLGAVAGAGLGEDPVDVRLDGGVAEVEAPGDLGVAQAGGEQGEARCCAPCQRLVEMSWALADPALELPRAAAAAAPAAAATVASTRRSRPSLASLTRNADDPS